MSVERNSVLIMKCGDEAVIRAPHFSRSFFALLIHVSPIDFRLSGCLFVVDGSGSGQQKKKEKKLDRKFFIHKFAPRKYTSYAHQIDGQGTGKGQSVCTPKNFSN